MEEVRGAMHKRNAAMFARPESRDEADAFVDTRIATVAACLEDLARLRAHGRFCVKEQLMTVRELLAGIGEAHSAHSTALLLRDRDVNAKFVDLTLWDQDDLRSLDARSEEHTSELQSLLRTSYAVFCLKKKNNLDKEL